MVVVGGYVCFQDSTKEMFFFSLMCHKEDIDFWAGAVPKLQDPLGCDTGFRSSV